MPNSSTASLWTKPRTGNKMKSLHKIICTTIVLESPSWNETSLSSGCCAEPARGGSCLKYLPSQQKGGGRGELAPSLPADMGLEDVQGQLRPVCITAESRGFARLCKPGSLLSPIFIVVITKYITRASSSSINQDDFLKLRSKRHITLPTKLIELTEVCVLSLLMVFKAHECYCNCLHNIDQ